MKDGKWVLKQIRAILPIGRNSPCDCSADLAYYLDAIEKKMRGKGKGGKK